MSIPLLALVLAAQAQEVVDRSKEYRQDQRPYKYYQAMETTWTVGRVAAVAGPPLVLAGFFISQGSSNRDPTAGGSTPRLHRRRWCRG